MSYIKKEIKSIILFLVIFVLTIITLSIVIPSGKPLMKVAPKQNPKIEKITFTAIGDSLTEGVGDATESGGFVPELKKDLLEHSVIEEISVDNFGKKGDTVQQINQRIKKDKQIQKSLEASDFITITAGGNDLIAAITKEFGSDLTVDSFKSYHIKYEKDLVELYQTIRRYNGKSPIYQMGIYNPIQLSFKNMSEFEQIVSNWDEETKAFLTTQKNSYFIDVNQLISEGIKSEDKTETTEGKTDNEIKGSLVQQAPNELISDTDNFHPNNLGYQLMATQFETTILQTNKSWRK